MAVMDRTQVLAQRLGTQRLSSAPLPRAADAVRLLTCVQSQERDHAFFSLGMRSVKAASGVTSWLVTLPWPDRARGLPHSSAAPVLRTDMAASQRH
jgi:hypothetical protein